MEWSGDLPRVFLSYRHGPADRQVVNLLTKRLSEDLCGPSPIAELFVDQQRLRAGDAWEPILRQELHSADIYLPIVSLHSAADCESFMWRTEFRVAAERWWNGAAWIIPVIVDDVVTVIDTDARTAFLSQSHCTPPGRAGFKTLLQSGWLDAVAHDVREACVRFTTQTPWDAESERAARVSAQDKLQRLAKLFDASSFPLGPVGRQEATDIVEAAAAALMVRGPSTRETLGRAARTLERIQMRMQRFEEQFDAVGEVVSRLKLLATQDQQDQLAANAPLLSPAALLGAELAAAQDDIRSAEDTLRAMAQRIPTAPPDARIPAQASIDEVGARLTLARVAAKAPEVDVEFIAAQIDIAKAAATELSTDHANLSAAATKFVADIGRMLGSTLARIIQSISQLLRRRDAVSAPPLPPPPLTPWEYYRQVFVGWKIQLEHAAEDRFRYDKRTLEGVSADLIRTFVALPLPPPLGKAEISEFVDDLRTFCATFRANHDVTAPYDVHERHVEFSISVRSAPEGSEASPILQLSLMRATYQGFEMGGGRLAFKEVLRERTIHF
ncbi:MAG: toll/interleukin-1 receptor domain-containing protein [Hyphomonadaceae bacterium]|nr:toll/interleukin-1 receptor domain-containing protein [Hyphomonadaceae bacterium]